MFGGCRLVGIMPGHGTAIVDQDLKANGQAGGKRKDETGSFGCKSGRRHVALKFVYLVRRSGCQLVKEGTCI